MIAVFIMTSTLTVSHLYRRILLIIFFYKTLEIYVGNESVFSFFVAHSSAA